MKTKVALGLSICCLVSALVGSAITSNVNAQYRLDPAMITSLIQFAEDPYRKHGLQMVTFYADVVTNNNTPITTIPTGKRFIVTDILVGDNNPGLLTDGKISMYDGTQQFFETHITSSNPGLHFQTGIAIDENRTLQMAVNPTPRHVSVSGYYVDL